MSANFGLKYVNQDGTLTPAGLMLFRDMAASSGGAAAWGDITGTLGAQGDLQAALDGKAAASHGHTISDVSGLSAALAAALSKTFETVNKNLDSAGATLAYSGGNLSTITYTNGVVKTLAYSGGNLSTVTLSGATPAGIALTKTLTYTGSDLTGVAYS